LLHNSYLQQHLDDEKWFAKLLKRDAISTQHFISRCKLA
jgi:hypothetical protein